MPSDDRQEGPEPPVGRLISSDLEVTLSHPPEADSECDEPPRGDEADRGS